MCKDYTDLCDGHGPLHKEKESLNRLEREKERIARRQLKLDSIIEGLSSSKLELANRLDTLKEELLDVDRNRKKAAAEVSCSVFFLLRLSEMFCFIIPSSESSL